MVEAEGGLREGRRERKPLEGWQGCRIVVEASGKSEEWLRFSLDRNKGFGPYFVLFLVLLSEVGYMVAKFTFLLKSNFTR